MGYENMTVKTVIDKINSGEMYLPAIQRKYVWNEEQITKLMDSILLGYPIGTFLFWDIDKDTIIEKGYSFYQFIKNYHERDFFSNTTAPDPIIKEKIWGVLDGQQRLTSLYISLQGTLAMKLPKKRWDNDDAFPRKELYFNLLSEKENDDDEITYEFKFLTVDEANKLQNKLWFKAKEILNIESVSELNQLMIANKWVSNDKIVNNLSTLWESLVNTAIINYFKIKKTSIDDVLDVFIRVNSGGTILSKTDLLFSTIVSHWDKARDEIENLLQSINKIGERFNFNNDFIMRTCLYLMDLPINLKVESFKKENIYEIRDKWDDIKLAIKKTAELLNEFGFNSENIISYNACIPIIYYIFKDGIIDGNTSQELKKYIIVAQLKQLYGIASNTVLNVTREQLRIKANDSDYKLRNSRFELKQFYGINFTGDKSFRYTEPEIDELFELEKGAYTFMILSLLYPNLKFSQQSFHQDHMHPYSSFSTKNLKEIGVAENDIINWQKDRNKLANLQLLEGKENESKNAKSLKEWLMVTSNKENAKYLPANASYELKDFYEFIKLRKELMSNKLKEILL